MHLAAQELPPVMDEYQALMRHFGQTQTRCDALLRSQAAEIAHLQGQAMRLRAAVIVRDTALAWERSLRMHWQSSQARVASEAEAGQGAPADDRVALEGSLAAADLVICQTGCLSHGAYWRVQDHCRRTGKTCVLVEQSAAAHIAGFLAPAPSETPIEWLPAPETSLP